MRSLTIQRCQQALRHQIDLRKVLQSKPRKSESSDYMRLDKDQKAENVKQNLDVDSYIGASSRRTMFKHYYQDQPTIGAIYPMHAGRGNFMEPDCRWTGNDFLGKLNEQFAPAIAESYSDIDKRVKKEVDQHRDKIKQNLERIFRERNPNKEFDFDREYARYLKLDSKKFTREYGFESD